MAGAPADGCRELRSFKKLYHFPKQGWGVTMNSYSEPLGAPRWAPLGRPRGPESNTTINSAAEVVMPACLARGGGHACMKRIIAYFFIIINMIYIYI